MTSQPERRSGVGPRSRAEDREGHLRTETPTEVEETPTEAERPAEIGEIPTDDAESRTEIEETPADDAENRTEIEETPTDAERATEAEGITTEAEMRNAAEGIKTLAATAAGVKKKREPPILFRAIRLCANSIPTFELKNEKTERGKLT